MKEKNSPDRDILIADIVEQYESALTQGRNPSVEVILSEHSDLAKELKGQIEAVNLLHEEAKKIPESVKQQMEKQIQYELKREEACQRIFTKTMAEYEKLYSAKEPEVSLNNLFEKIRPLRSVRLAALDKKMVGEFAYHFGLSKIRISPDFYAIVQIKDNNMQFIFRNSQDHSPANEFDGGKLVIGESNFSITGYDVEAPLGKILEQNTKTVIVTKNGKEYQLP